MKVQRDGDCVLLSHGEWELSINEADAGFYLRNVKANDGFRVEGEGAIRSLLEVLSEANPAFRRALREDVITRKTPLTDPEAVQPRRIGHVQTVKLYEWRLEEIKRFFTAWEAGELAARKALEGINFTLGATLPDLT